MTQTSLGGRVLSALQLPLFLLRPPDGYGVLRTTGRRSGKRRLRCVRIVRRGRQACMVAIHGPGVGWLANLTAEPHVAVRIRGGWLRAVAEVGADALPQDLRAAYCDDVGLFCYGEHLIWRRGRPTPDRIRHLHETWIETGTLVTLTFEDESQR